MMLITLNMILKYYIFGVCGTMIVTNQDLLGNI